MNPFEGRSNQEIASDFFTTFYSGGMNTIYSVGKALFEDDEDELYYIAGIQALVASSIYGTVKFLNWYQGPRYAITAFAASERMSVARHMASRAAFVPAASVAAGYGLGAIVGTALMAPFGKAKEAIRLYSNPVGFIEDAILGLPGNVKTILSHYL